MGCCNSKKVVRITVNTLEAAQAVPEIQRRLNRMACEVPLVGDFHYNGHQLLQHKLNLVDQCGSSARFESSVFRKQVDSQFDVLHIGCRVVLVLAVIDFVFCIQTRDGLRCLVLVEHMRVVVDPGAYCGEGNDSKRAAGDRSRAESQSGVTQSLPETRRNGSRNE